MPSNFGIYLKCVSSHTNRPTMLGRAPHTYPGGSSAFLYWSYSGCGRPIVLAYACAVVDLRMGMVLRLDNGPESTCTSFVFGLKHPAQGPLQLCQRRICVSLRLQAAKRKTNKSICKHVPLAISNLTVQIFRNSCTFNCCSAR